MILENSRIQLEFDEATGAIVGFLNKNTGWQLIRQKKLAEGIRLLVPINLEQRNNRVLSEHQTLSSFDKTDDTHATLVWEKVKGEISGELDIKVTLDVVLDQEKATFQMTIDNHSPYVVEEAWCPVLGGLWKPEGEEHLHGRTVYFQGSFTDTNFANFPEWDCGYWGTDHPTSIRSYPDIHASVPCYVVENGKQGIYFGHHHDDMSVCSFVQELLPGYLDSMNKKLPQETEIDGVPVGFKCSMARLPFVTPGECVTLAPAVVALYEGTWEKALDYFKAWRETWHKEQDMPAWEKDIDCWLTLHIGDPEGSVRRKFTDLPAIARQAKEDGVKAIQLIGWARGGQDGAEPYQDVNPLLGTREELKAAIREIEEMGVKVMLMCKFKWCDATTKEFKQELEPLIARDMFGHPVYFNGYGYQNITELLNGGSASGGSRRHGYAMCQNSKEYQDIAVREFQKIVDLGSSGILYDELCMEYLFCYDTRHKHRWGDSLLKGHMEIAKKFKEVAKAAGRDFMFAAEGPNDRQAEIYTTNYLRSWDRNCNAAYRYAMPDIRPATCLTGWDDREMVNQCITFGYVINYEPYNFKGTTADIPQTVAYGKKANELRMLLREYLWDGEFCYRLGATVEPGKGDGNFIYAVHKNAEGKSAVVISNQSGDTEAEFKVTLENGNTNFRAYTVEGKPEIIKKKVTVPARSMVILVEK